MPNIKEMTKIIEFTNPKQPILLEGIHGIGKSEVVKQIFEKKGFDVITLFLGQSSDAGDIIGLPKIITDESTGYIYTDFCPPKWWPTDMNGKYIIFLDELNRGRPEIMQCVMDMVLNRKLNGRELPKNTWIIGAMNPDDESGFYQVSELDPAFLDRWNRYKFIPSKEDWIYWAIKNKVHKHVIGYIAKNTHDLDPETNPNENAKITAIQPSRRTWERVSNNIKLMEKKSLDLEVLSNMLMGMVGPSVTGKFINYIKTDGKGITAPAVILNYDDTLQKKIKNTKNQELLVLNIEMFNWFGEHIKELLISDINAKKWVSNLKRYLNSVSPEIMSHFLSTMRDLNDDSVEWPRVILSIDNTLAEKFLEILDGSEYEIEDESDD